MSRLTRSERLAAKGRPKRRAAKTHFFKYQLATNPSRAEENDLKRALQESLEEQDSKKSCNTSSSTNSSDVSRSTNNSTFSNHSTRSSSCSTSLKRTRSSTIANNHTTNKRNKLNESIEPQINQKCDGNQSVLVEPTKIASPHITKAIRTYSRSQPKVVTKSIDGLKPPTPTHTNEPNSNLSGISKETRAKISSQSNTSRSTQTPSGKLVSLASTVINNHSKQNHSDKLDPQVRNERSSVPQDITAAPKIIQTSTPIQDQYLKFKRESKNYAYVKMTALKVSTSKSPSGCSKSTNVKKSSPNGAIHNNSTSKDKISPKASSSLNGNDSVTGQSGRHSLDKTTKVLNTNGAKFGSNSNSKTLTESFGKKPPNISPSKIVPDNGKALDKIKIAEAPPKVGQGSQVGRNSIPKQDIHDLSQNGTQIPRNDCSLDDTIDLSKKKNQNQADVKVTKRRSPQGSWSLLGVPEEKVIYLRDDEPPRRLICYPAIKHIEGDVIQVRDSVLLRSGARKTDLPYIAKVCAFWEDAETGGVMMSLFWYYRPEHTEEGRKPHHLADEIFASRHRDVDSVECIEDKCYVLTFNEYCRYRKRCKMEQVNATWSLTDVTIPLSNESYPRRNRIPESDVNPELVFCCRQIYDSRMKRLVKNPLINTKYGHI